MKEVFARHFEERFKSSTYSDCFGLESINMAEITPLEAMRLEEPFDIQEISMALEQMDPGKAPGPDGFNAKYIKFMWSAIQQDIQIIFNEFHLSSKLPGGLNSSFMTLIPKVFQPSKVQDYRPISLINCTMKILLKLLANRMKNVLHKLVAEEQSAFIKGRLISDSILITSEVVHNLQTGQSKGIVLKLDFEKAFDTTDWDFLMHTLQRMGFGDRWSSWIHSIISTAKPSILVNGSPSREFCMERGLRQGDPISPMLFILVTQTLHTLLAKATEVGIISGIKMGHNLSLSLQQFADDTIIFLEDSWEAVRGIKILLTIFQFCQASKLILQKVFSMRQDQSRPKLWSGLVG